MGCGTDTTCRYHGCRRTSSMVYRLRGLVSRMRRIRSFTCSGRGVRTPAHTHAPRQTHKPHTETHTHWHAGTHTRPRPRLHQPTHHTAPAQAPTCEEMKSGAAYSPFKIFWYSLEVLSCSKGR